MNLENISDLFELKQITKFEIKKKKNYTINFNSNKNLIKKIGELITQINKNEKITFHNKKQKKNYTTNINTVFEQISKSSENLKNKKISEKKLIIKIVDIKKNTEKNLFHNFPFLNSDPKNNIKELKDLKKVIIKKICEYYSEKYLNETLKKKEEKISFKKFVNILKEDINEFSGKFHTNIFDFQKKYFGQKNLLDSFKKKISVLLNKEDNTIIGTKEILDKLKNEKKILNDFFSKIENEKDLKKKIQDLKTNLEICNNFENTSLFLKDEILKKKSFLPFEKIKEEFGKKNLKSTSSRFILDNTIIYDSEKLSLGSNFNRSFSDDKLKTSNLDNLKIFEIFENTKKELIKKNDNLSETNKIILQKNELLLKKLNSFENLNKNENNQLQNENINLFQKSKKNEKIILIKEKLKKILNSDSLNLKELKNLKSKIQKLSRKIRKFHRSKKKCKNCKKNLKNLKNAESEKKQLNKKNSKLLEELLILNSKQKKLKLQNSKTQINSEDLEKLQNEKNELEMKNKILNQKIELLGRLEAEDMFYEEDSIKFENTEKPENKQKQENNNNGENNYNFDKSKINKNKKKTKEKKDTFPMINNEYYSFGRNFKMTKTLEAVSEEERSSFHQSQESSLNYRNSYHDFLEKRKITKTKKKKNFNFCSNFKFNYNWPGIFHFIGKQEKFGRNKGMSKSKKNIFDKDKILKNILEYQMSESQLKNSKLSLPNLSFNEEKGKNKKIVETSKKQVLEEMLKKKIIRFFGKFENLENKVFLKENKMRKIKDNLENLLFFLKDKKTLEIINNEEENLLTTQNFEKSEKTLSKEEFEIKENKKSFEKDEDFDNMETIVEDKKKLKENDEILYLKEENEDLREMVMNVFERLVPMVEDQIEDIKQIIPNRDCLMEIINILENKIYENEEESNEHEENENLQASHQNEVSNLNEEISGNENNEIFESFDIEKNRHSVKNNENKEYFKKVGNHQNSESSENEELENDIEFNKNNQKNGKNLKIEEYDNLENEESGENEEDINYDVFEKNQKDDDEIKSDELFEEDDIIDNDNFLIDKEDIDDGENLMEGNLNLNEDLENNSDIYDFEEINKKKKFGNLDNREFIENMKNYKKKFPEKKEKIPKKENLINLENYQMIKKVFDNLGEKIFGLIKKNTSSLKNIEKDLKNKQIIKHNLKSAQSSINNIKELISFIHQNLQNFFTDFQKIEKTEKIQKTDKTRKRLLSFQNMCFVLNSHTNLKMDQKIKKNSENFSRNNSAPSFKIDNKKVSQFDLRKKIENFLIVNEIGIPSKLIVRAEDTEEMDLFEERGKFKERGQRLSRSFEGVNDGLEYFEKNSLNSNSENRGNEDFGENRENEDFEENRENEDFEENRVNEDFEENRGNEDFEENRGNEDFRENRENEDFRENRGNEDFGENRGNEDFEESRGNEDFEENRVNEDFVLRKIDVDDFEENRVNEDFEESEGFSGYEVNGNGEENINKENRDHFRVLDQNNVVDYDNFEEDDIDDNNYSENKKHLRKNIVNDNNNLSLNNNIINFQNFSEYLNNYINFFKHEENNFKAKTILKKLTKISKILKNEIPVKNPKITSEKKIDNLNNLLINKENSIIFLKDRISMLEQTLELRTNQLAVLKKKTSDESSPSQKQKKEKTIKTLKSKLKEYSKKLKTYKEEKKSQISQNDNLSQNLQNLITKYNTLKKEYNKTQQIIENFDEEQNQNLEMSKIIKELQQTIEEYKDEYIKLQKISSKKILKLKKIISKLKIEKKDIKNYYSDDNVRLSMKKKADFIMLENDLRQKELYIKSLQMRIRELKNFNGNFVNRSHYEVRGKKSNNVSYLD